MDKILMYISGSVVPKARPRVTRNGTFMPERYKAWRNHAETEILSYLKGLRIKTSMPIQRAEIDVQLVGKHNMNGDADNILGSYLDALVAAGMLKNDNLTCVPKVSLEHINPNDKESGAFITLTLLPAVVAVKKTRVESKTVTPV